ncbi:Broad specificity phosphatase PhoE [Pseudooceanicola antarcticus]|uniref:Broad specificity phosphatase PhoE n=1 Tax=Pseudooceanicola antarcticus TaxID=1247613 RepID=A0A285IRR5_9RHOB|nr:histidine phosphatase family protein [Pseudooceanicola antarcticus]PJE31878.1 histidine phosphatase family protein [Pseudooceanicola antarcticus]SNY50654.1 Broad specificity phosphatase PhoE [Pseudooceanicola antarcticus]
MSRLFLVRHGPTHAKALIGWTDLPADLSDRARIARLSDWLPAKARLVSSDLTRTRTTADALATPDRVRLPDEPELRELHFGDWEGLSANEVEARDPELSRDFWTDPGATRPPGGESWHQMEARCSAALDRLMAAGGDLIVVCHFAVILGQIARHRGCPPREVLSQKIEPLSVTLVQQAPSGISVTPINHNP